MDSRFMYRSLTRERGTSPAGLQRPFAKAQRRVSEERDSLSAIQNPKRRRAAALHMTKPAVRQIGPDETLFFDG